MDQSRLRDRFPAWSRVSDQGGAGVVLLRLCVVPTENTKNEGLCDTA